MQSTPFPGVWTGEKSVVGLMGIGFESVVEVRAFEHPLIGEGRQLALLCKARSSSAGPVGGREWYHSSQEAVLHLEEKRKLQLDPGCRQWGNPALFFLGQMVVMGCVEWSFLVCAATLTVCLEGMLQLLLLFPLDPWCMFLLQSLEW